MTAVLPGTEDLAEVVGQVWSSMLLADGGVVPVEAAVLPDPSHPGWSAGIDVLGPRSLRVTVAVDEESARSMTRHLLRAERPGDDDVADALGELVNIVGGNLKSLMPAPSALSLPYAAPGVRSPAADAPVCAVEATWRGRPVLVTVHDTPSPQGELP